MIVDIKKSAVEIKDTTTELYFDGKAKLRANRKKMLRGFCLFVIYTFTYYLVPTLLSIIYFFFQQEYRYEVDINLSKLDKIKCFLEIPAIKVPGGTRLSDVRVSVRPGNSKVPAFTVCSTQTYEWEHLQCLYFCDEVEIKHNKEFDTKSIEDFDFKKDKVFADISFKVGINVFFKHVYITLHHKISRDMKEPQKKRQGGKFLEFSEFDVIDEANDFGFNMIVDIDIPEFLKLTFEKFSLNVTGKCEDQVRGGIRNFELLDIEVENGQKNSRFAVKISSVPSSIKIPEIAKFIRSIADVSKKTISLEGFLRNNNSFSPESHKYASALLRKYAIKMELGEPVSKKRELAIDYSVILNVLKFSQPEIDASLQIHKSIHSFVECIFDVLKVVSISRDIKLCLNLNKNIPEASKNKIGDLYITKVIAQDNLEYLYFDVKADIQDFSDFVSSSINSEGDYVSVFFDPSYSNISSLLEGVKIVFDLKGEIKVLDKESCYEPSYSSRGSYRNENNINIAVDMEPRCPENNNILTDSCEIYISTKHYSPQNSITIRILEDFDMYLRLERFRMVARIQKSDISLSRSDVPRETIQIKDGVKIRISLATEGNEDPENNNLLDLNRIILSIFQDIDFIKKYLGQYVENMYYRAQNNRKSQFFETIDNRIKFDYMLRPFLNTAYRKSRVLINMDEKKPIKEDDVVISLEIKIPSIGLQIFDTKNLQQPEVIIENMPTSLKVVSNIVKHKICNNFEGDVVFYTRLNGLNVLKEFKVVPECKSSLLKNILSSLISAESLSLQSGISMLESNLSKNCIPGFTLLNEKVYGEEIIMNADLIVNTAHIDKAIIGFKLKRKILKNKDYYFAIKVPNNINVRISEIFECENRQSSKVLATMGTKGFEVIVGRKGLGIISEEISANLCIYNRLITSLKHHRIEFHFTEDNEEHAKHLQAYDKYLESRNLRKELQETSNEIQADYVEHSGDLSEYGTALRENQKHCSETCIFYFDIEPLKILKNIFAKEDKLSETSEKKIDTQKLFDNIRCIVRMFINFSGLFKKVDLKEFEKNRRFLFYRSNSKSCNIESIKSLDNIFNMFPINDNFLDKISKIVEKVYSQESHTSLDLNLGMIFYDEENENLEKFHELKWFVDVFYSIKVAAGKKNLNSFLSTLKTRFKPLVISIPCNILIELNDEIIPLMAESDKKLEIPSSFLENVLCFPKQLCSLLSSTMFLLEKIFLPTKLGSFYVYLKKRGTVAPMVKAFFGGEFMPELKISHQKSQGNIFLYFPYSESPVKYIFRKAVKQVSLVSFLKALLSILKIVINSSLNEILSLLTLILQYF